jgi:LysR family transcriptional regulator, low CO2-responsive transcriptional regulator
MPRARLRRFFRHGLLPQLLVFEAVARLGSVTRAAEELHLAQPTVSLQLKKLADTMEVTLFEPRGRRLVLTAAGHALHEACAELIHFLERTEAKLHAFRAPRTEPLRIAAEPEVRTAAARLIADFCARHPGIQASLHVAPSDELLERFARGADDVYLFVLEVDGLPEERRWTLAHPKARSPSRAAGLFLRDALLDGPPGRTNHGPQPGDNDAWSSSANTTRR